MPGLSQFGHTYQNILRTGEFVINFISKNYYDACIATINNGDETDEIAAGGFTEEKAETVDCLRLKEAFLSLECKFEKEVKLCEDGKTSVIIGRVIHIAADENYAKGLDEKYGENGFMLYIHAAKNLKTGEGKPTAVAVCKIARVNEES
jgi:flavin reductase (DIM6/NTAB) family NADH-FMN oxidoreductase RutF